MATADTIPSSMPITPLQLSGFLTGDTIRVRGDTGELQFSVQLSVAKKLFPENPHPLDAISQTPEHLPSEGFGFSPPTGGDEVESFGGRVVTRLRSGAISRMDYFPRVPLWSAVVGTPRWRRGRRRAGAKEAFERLLRRRSCPVKPCSSYALFVMGNWGDAGAQCSSFGEASKRVARMWCQLPQEERKVYEEMASKDKERYKWQLEMFMSNCV